MTLVDGIVLGVIAVVLGLAAWYVYRAKKKGTKCIGCPTAGECSGDCGNCHK